MVEVSFLLLRLLFSLEISRYQIHRYFLILQFKNKFSHSSCPSFCFDFTQLKMTPSEGFPEIEILHGTSFTISQMTHTQYVVQKF